MIWLSHIYFEPNEILTSCRGTEGLAGWWLGPEWTWWRCDRGPTVPASSSPCILEEVLTICSVSSLQKKKSQISPTQYWFTQTGENDENISSISYKIRRIKISVCLTWIVATCAQCRFLILFGLKKMHYITTLIRRFYILTHAAIV